MKRVLLEPILKIFLKASVIPSRSFGAESRLDALNLGLRVTARNNKAFLRWVLVLTIISPIGWVSAQSPVTKLTFEEAVVIGLQRNVILNQQKNQLESTQAQKLNAVGNYMPNLNVTGSFNRQEGQQANSTNGNLENLTTDYVGAQLNAGLTVFNGFRNYNTLTQANNQVMAQGYLIKRSTQDVVSNVANQYLQVLLDQELVRIAEENLKTQNTILEQMQGFHEVGSRPITDVYDQDALAKTAQVLLIRAKNTLLNDKSILAQTLQLDPSQPFEVIYPAMAADLSRYKDMSLDSLINVAMEYRADLKQLDHQAKANKYAFKSSLSPALPSVSLFANYGSFYYSLIAQDFSGQFGTTNPSLSYGANLTIPIFTRFQTKFQRTNFKVQYDNSLLNYQNLEKTVKLDVQRAHNNFISALENYEASLAQFQAGELSLNTQRESYELGISTQVALAQANQTHVLGSAAKVQAEVTLLFQKILLEYAMGTLQPELIKP
ncbi:MAG: TolC family protein [Cyclobacteriaceae bacterium]|nr:TolC family protein [Cyclobacteriaceae bacterium]